MEKLSEMLDKYVVVSTSRINDKYNLFIVPIAKIYNDINVCDILDNSEFDKDTKCEVLSYYYDNEDINIVNVEGYENEFDYVDEELNNNIIEEYYNYILNPNEEDDEPPFIKLSFQDCDIIIVN